MAKKAKIRLTTGYVKPKTIKLKGKWEIIEKKPIFLIDKSIKKKKLY